MRRPRVAFVVNGGPGSALGERAEAFAARLAARFACRLVFRTGGKGQAVGRMLAEIAAAAPAVCYVLDLAASGVAAAGAYKLATATPFVLDTGDAVVELGRALGRSWAGTAATRGMEAYALRAASAVVVRGTFHRTLLARRGVRAEFVPDGVVVDQFAPAQGAPPNADPARPLVVGLVGSSVWVPVRGTCYGWELVELIRILRSRLPRPVRGVLIGDGSGVEVLRRRCAEYGLGGAVEFAGRVPYADLPVRLREFDICLSTQTNDVIGNVRTTGKLPLYLAAGRFVLASRVGEAAGLLPSNMLVDFVGETDPAYPTKLAARVEALVAAGEDFTHRSECVALARLHFEYDRLAPRVGAVLDGVLGTSSRAGRGSGEPADTPPYQDLFTTTPTPPNKPAGEHGH
ncbi:MAG: glycosyl transferase group 1 [Gemmataceae bacterium]|nr:glycosyl transferase group 1 [Gemmataceae bacterium]